MTEEPFFVDTSFRVFSESAGNVQTGNDSIGYVRHKSPDEVPSGRNDLKLNFNDNEQITDSDLMALRFLPGIDQVSLGDTGIGDAGCEHLCELQKLRNV